jgi:hypothetical protein
VKGGKDNENEDDEAHSCVECVETESLASFGGQTLDAQRRNGPRVTNGRKLLRHPG